jgi:hypothetical protein
MITLGHVYWAMEHDWYYYSGTNALSGEITIYTYDDMTPGASLAFTDFQDLRNWAGY